MIYDNLKLLCGKKVTISVIRCIWVNTDDQSIVLN